MPNKKQVSAERSSSKRRRKKITESGTKSNGRKTVKGSERAASDLGKLEEPMSPMPPQHQSKPGKESAIKPRPRYEAPLYKGSEKLKKKVAIVTGADSGIGRPVAVLFAREGADIAFSFLEPEEKDADETIRVIEAEGRRAYAVAGDLQNPTLIRRNNHGRR